jgi:cell division protein FtsB
LGRLKRFLLPSVVGLALYFALFGGEYSVFEARRARVERDQALEALAELRRVNDSLTAWADSLQTDPATLERVARERFGLIRDGEVLYRFTEPDSGEVADSAAGGR